MRRNSRTIKLASAVLVSTSLFLAYHNATTLSVTAAEETQSGGTPSPPMGFSSTATDQKLKGLDMKALRRLDCRVEGSSCAACLGRIRKRLDKEKGVAMVAVAIKRPYGLAVIYDSTKTDKDKLLAAGLKGEASQATFHDAVDEKIDKVPFILWPKFNQLLHKTSSSSEPLEVK